MKYINIPKSSDTTIDLAAITNNYKGIIIAYKEGMAVGSISYCSDTDLWYFCNNIDYEQFDTCKGTLLELEFSTTCPLLFIEELLVEEQPINPTKHNKIPNVIISEFFNLNIFFIAIFSYKFLLLFFHEMILEILLF